MMNDASALILPGWALPPDIYSELRLLPEGVRAAIFDYGFFSGASESMNIPDAIGASLLVAHSMGCLHAIKLAATLEPVKALVLLNPFPKFTGSGGFPGRPQKDVDAMKGRLASSPVALLKSFYRSCAAPESFKVAPPPVLNAEALAEGLDLLDSGDARTAAASLKKPCLAICADYDSIVACETSGSLMGLIQGIRMERIQGAGHFMPMTRTDECRRLIEGFLVGCGVLDD